MDGGVGELRVRCLRRDDGACEVQARSERGWTEKVCEGSDPHALLRAVVSFSAVAQALAPE